MDAIESTVPGPGVDTCLLHQYEDQLSDIKRELAEASQDILMLVPDDDDLSEQKSRLSKGLFDACLKIRYLLRGQSQSSMPSDGKGSVKLPKLDVPTFDGNLVNWRSFWEQFSVSVHDRSQLMDSEKLAYLKHALKGGLAKHAVEGLSGSGEHYKEAIACLQKCYDRPRLIHQAHVRAILEVPAPKEGNGRELRRLYDTVTQHLRALKVMDHEPSGPFITSALELKLDATTMFEWQKYSQDSLRVPHFSTLLEFINLRAQASETSVPDFVKKRQPEIATWRRGSTPHSAASFTANVDDSCAVCKSGKHPLYACQKFKALPHEQIMSIQKDDGLCMNCFKAGHFVRRCTSTQRCRRCQKPHHTLLHLEVKPEHREQGAAFPLPTSTQNPNDHPITVLSHVAPIHSPSCQVLLMTCCVLVTTPMATLHKRELYLTLLPRPHLYRSAWQHLRLPRSCQLGQITGIGGISCRSASQSIVWFGVAPVWIPDKVLEVEAVILPKVTCDLPLHPVALDRKWHHLSGIRLADPDFGSPGKIDILLGVDAFSNILLHGRRYGPPGSPTALETSFGWVLSGAVHIDRPQTQIVSCHATTLSADDLLRKFWEVEELDASRPALSLEERSVVTHFHDTHRRDKSGRFIVPLPKKPDARPLGESRSLAVQRLHSLERSLRCKNQFQEFSGVVEEYLEMGHAEPVPETDLEKPRTEVFYLPMQAVVKESSTTTKIRAVFDASAKSSSGISLNDQLLVGPTIHSALVGCVASFSSPSHSAHHRCEPHVPRGPPPHE